MYGCEHAWPAYMTALIFLGPELSQSTADFLRASLSGLFSCSSPAIYAVKTIAGSCEA